MVFILTSCKSNSNYSSTTFLSSFPNDIIEVNSDDLSNKGLICNTKSFDPTLENVGFWFVDDKKFEKWFNGNFQYQTDGFEFVQIEREVYTSYGITEDTITLNYSDDENSQPYSMDEKIDRTNLSLYYKGGYIGDCIVLKGKERFLSVLEQISDVYRKENQKKLNKRKI